MPSSRYSGLKPTVSSAPSKVASTASLAWPTSWVTASSSRPPGPMVSRTGVASRAMSRTRRTASPNAARETTMRLG